MKAERERPITEAFRAIADSLVDDYEITDMLTGLTVDCARILDIASVGILLADEKGVLQVAATSTERMQLMELYQVQCRQGPCLDCYRDGTAVLVADLNRQRKRWPDFAAVALEAGYASVHAVPLRFRGKVLGTVGLFGTRPGALNAEDLKLAQAIGHVAGVALVTNKATADQIVINTQLQTALNSRVVLEQAKGVLAHSGNLDVEQAFTMLRGYARDHNLRLKDIAGAVVSRELPTGQVLDHARAKTTTARRGSR